MSSSCAATALSPSFVADLLSRPHSASADAGSFSPRLHQMLRASARDARQADERGDNLRAADAYTDLLELGAEDYRDQAIARLQQLYPMGDSWRASRNHSDTFRHAMSSRVESGDAEVVSEEPPVVCHGRPKSGPRQRVLLRSHVRSLAPAVRAAQSAESRRGGSHPRVIGHTTSSVEHAHSTRVLSAR